MTTPPLVRRLLLSLAVVGVTAYGASAAPLRIMPLGDSITAGYVDNYTWQTPFTFGYRGPLYTLLTKAGYKFKFVGASPEPFDGQLGVPKKIRWPGSPPPKAGFSSRLRRNGFQQPCRRHAQSQRWPWPVG